MSHLGGGLVQCLARRNVTYAGYESSVSHHRQSSITITMRSSERSIRKRSSQAGMDRMDPFLYFTLSQDTIIGGLSIISKEKFPAEVKGIIVIPVARFEIADFSLSDSGLGMDG